MCLSIISMMFMAFTMLLPAFFQAARASALAVLAWALIFSLYALLLKFVLLRKALPMSEAAKSRGPGQGMSAIFSNQTWINYQNNIE